MAPKTFDDLDWQRVCDAIASRCLGRDAEELALDLGLLPDRDSCERRRREIDEATAAYARGVQPPLRGLDVLGNALVRARKQDVLPAEDLLRIGASAATAGRVRTWARTASALPLVGEHCARLADVAVVAADIARCIEPTGEVADAASPELGPLRRRVQRLRDHILQRLEKIARSTRYEGILQDDYVTIRDERYVLPVRAGERGDFPGIVHGQSGSGQTLFIEPQELIDANNDLRIAQLEVENEVRRILSQLSRTVAKNADALESNQDVLVYLDLTFATAGVADSLGCTLPALNADGDYRIALRAARHPVLAIRERAGELESVVANDILLEGVCGLVISGPNTGGKTVTLKTIGLAALMTRAGLTIPVASDSALPWFDTIHTDIGDEQGVDRDLSTFSGHVANIARFLPDVAPGALVLLDELFAGTDPQQGTALGRALLDVLVDRGAFVAVTTHLEGLKTVGFEDDRFAVASVTFDVDRLRPTYELRSGIPGSSYALRIASRLGLDEDVITRAENALGGSDAGDREQLLARLEREFVGLQAARAEANALRATLDARERALDERQAKLADRDRAQADTEARALAEEAKTLKHAIRKHEKTLRRMADPETAEQAEALRRELAEARAATDQATGVRKRARDKAPAVADVERPAVAPGGVAVGDTVWVATFKRSGEVLELDAAGQRAVVQIGPLRTNVGLDDLRASSAQDQPAAEESRVVVTASRNVENTVDLRGERVDEAIDKLDAFMDRAARAPGATLYVIHGHGTGALKRAVRDHLGRVPYRIEWRPGGQGEGGDGATVVVFGT